MRGGVCLVIHPDQLTYVIVNILSLLRSVTDVCDVPVFVIGIGQRHSALHDRTDQIRRAVASVVTGTGGIGIARCHRRPRVHGPSGDPVQRVVNIIQAAVGIAQRRRLVLRIVGEGRGVFGPVRAVVFRELVEQLVLVVAHLPRIGVVRPGQQGLPHRPAYRMLFVKYLL